MTSPAPLLQSSDIGTLLGETLTESETGQVNLLIDFATEKLRSPTVRAVIGDVDQRIASGELRPGLLRGAMLTAVGRAFDVLRVGLRVRSMQYPEVQTTYADSVAELVYFTDAELAELAPEHGDGVHGNAFTIRIA